MADLKLDADTQKQIVEDLKASSSAFRKERMANLMETALANPELVQSVDKFLTAQQQKLEANKKYKMADETVNEQGVLVNTYFGGLAMTDDAGNILKKPNGEIMRTNDYEGTEGTTYSGKPIIEGDTFKAFKPFHDNQRIADAELKENLAAALKGKNPTASELNTLYEYSIALDQDSKAFRKARQNNADEKSTENKMSQLVEPIRNENITLTGGSAKNTLMPVLADNLGSDMKVANAPAAGRGGISFS